MDSLTDGALEYQRAAPAQDILSGPSGSRTATNRFELCHASRLPPSPSLDITLAHEPSDEAPDQADFIAQTNQLGTDDQQQMLQPPRSDSSRQLSSSIQISPEKSSH